jgi:hypothetical protein
MRATQKHRGGVRQGVNVAELQGRSSRSAVFLNHAEALRQALGR